MDGWEGGWGLSKLRWEGIIGKLGIGDRSQTLFFFFLSSEEWYGSRGKIGYPFWLVCLWNGLGWAG